MLGLSAVVELVNISGYSHAKGNQQDPGMDA